MQTFFICQYWQSMQVGSISDQPLAAICHGWNYNKRYWSVDIQNLVKLSIQKAIIYNRCSKLKLQDIDINTRYEAQLDKINILKEKAESEGAKPPEKAAAEGLQAQPEARQEVTPTPKRVGSN